MLTHGAVRERRHTRANLIGQDLQRGLELVRIRILRPFEPVMRLRGAEHMRVEGERIAVSTGILRSPVPGDTVSADIRTPKLLVHVQWVAVRRVQPEPKREADLVLTELERADRAEVHVVIRVEHEQPFVAA